MTTFLAPVGAAMMLIGLIVWAVSGWMDPER